MSQCNHRALFSKCNLFFGLNCGQFAVSNYYNYVLLPPTIHADKNWPTRLNLISYPCPTINFQPNLNFTLCQNHSFGFSTLTVIFLLSVNCPLTNIRMVCVCWGGGLEFNHILTDVPQGGTLSEWPSHRVPPQTHILVCVRVLVCVYFTFI